MIIAVQCIVRYGLAMVEGIDITLSTLGLIVLVLATVLIAAGGYVINDFYDVVADKINKPKKQIVQKLIDEKQTKLFYFLLTFSGLGLGFILTNLMGQSAYFMYFAVSALLLYLYARFLKKYALVGNLIISFLVALSVLLVPIFELLPPLTEMTNDEQIALQMVIFSIFTAVALFAFGITLVREIAKDIEDIQGDHVAGYKTLPILIGAQGAARVAVVLILINITAISWYTFTFLYNFKIAVVVIFFAIIASLGFCASKLWEATKKSELSRVSLILKVIMFVGICIIPILIYAICYA